MKTYPSIKKELKPLEGIKIYAFDKLDGSNIRAEWNKKRGFYKFGTRTQLIDSTKGNIWDESVYLIRQHEKYLEDVFRSQNWDRVTAFFEFWGENSFAGSHEEEMHKVTLIDVNPYKKGFLSPEEFIDIFSDYDCIPALLYSGPFTFELTDSVKDGSLEGMTFEGVVCKYKYKNQHQMFKIKNRAWLDKLRAHCKGNDALFRRLV